MYRSWMIILFFGLLPYTITQVHDCVHLAVHVHECESTSCVFVCFLTLTGSLLSIQALIRWWLPSLALAFFNYWVEVGGVRGSVGKKDWKHPKPTFSPLPFTCTFAFKPFQRTLFLLTHVFLHKFSKIKNKEG